MLYEKKSVFKGIESKAKSNRRENIYKKDEIASVSKRIVEYDRFIRSASHVNIYALLVFFSLVSRFIRSISALVSVTRSFAFYYLCAHSCCIRYLIRIHVVGSMYMCAFLSLVFGWVSEWARESWFSTRCDTKYTVYSDTWIGEAF